MCSKHLGGSFMILAYLIKQLCMFEYPRVACLYYLGRCAITLALHHIITCHHFNFIRSMYGS